MESIISEYGYNVNREFLKLSTYENKDMVKKGMKFISRRISDEMKKKDLTQTDLSKKAKVGQSTVNRILNTAVNARIGTLNKIASVLGVPLEYLITENETKALLCLEVSRMNADEIHQTLLHLEKEKLYRESKKAS